MAEEKKEPWLNLLALTTVILAVCATLATFKGGGHSTRSVLRQNQASDRWAHYQAKSIKGNLFEMAKERLDLDLKEFDARGSREVRMEIERQQARYAEEVSRYNAEKQEIQAQARKLEQERDDAQKHGQGFGLAVIYLQIGILLSSIAALLKQKNVYFLGLGVGVVGIVYFVNGFFLFFKP